MKSEDKKEGKKMMLGEVTLKGSTSNKTDWKLEDGTIVSQRMLSRILGIEDRNLREYIDKMPEYARNNVHKAIEWWFTKDFVLTDKDGNKMKFVELKEEKFFHDTRKSKHDANRAKLGEEREELEMEITRGDYILREKVVHRIAEISKKFSTKLFAFPSRVASRLVSATTAEEVKTILKDELKKITEEIDSWPIFP